MVGAEADDVRLMALDPDPFNRWDAGQRIATRALLNAVADGTEPADPLPAEFVAALEATIREASLDTAFRALCLALPAEETLADLIEACDPDRVHRVREAARRQIGVGLAADLDELYHTLTVNRPYRPDARDAGDRALRNAALALLAASSSGGIDLARRQFEGANNMTDRMAALRAVNDLEDDTRDALLAAFHARFRDDHLVVDKWLSLEASSSRAGTLDRVRALLEHDAFSLDRPNKVRALIGAFATANPVCFHDAGGAGYRFLAEQVARIDGRNPQLAARLVQPLCRWRRLEPGRRDLMRAELAGLAAGASRDLAEIVARSLG